MVDLEKNKDGELALERLQKAISKLVNLGDVVVEVPASIGLTFYPENNANAEQLIRHADQAMYIAKQAGKNRYHVFEFEHGNK